MSNYLCHSAHCSMMLRRVKIWSVHPCPFRKPTCSCLSRWSTASEIPPMMSLARILLGTDRRMTPLQLLQLLRACSPCWRSLLLDMPGPPCRPACPPLSSSSLNERNRIRNYKGIQPNCQIMVIWHIPHMCRLNRVSIIESHLGAIIPLSRFIRTNQRYVQCNHYSFSFTLQKL